MTCDSPLASEFIQARHFTPGRRVAIDLGIVHSTEGNGSARSVALWFASEASPQASPHYIVDGVERIQCVREADTAWHAPGANANGIGVEFCAFAHWTEAQWRASGVIEMAAPLFEDISRRVGFPLERRSVAELVAGGDRGIAGHVDISQAFKRSDHWDPGPGFPWDYFIGLCVLARSQSPSTLPTT